MTGHAILAQLDTQRKNLVHLITINSPAAPIVQRAYDTACKAAGIDADTWEGLR